MFDGIGLDEAEQPAVQISHGGAGVEMDTCAAWNTGDSPCVLREGRKISKQHYVAIFNEMINSCPHNGVDTKTYGGAKVDGRIVYGFDIEKTFDIGLNNTRR